MNRKNPFLFLFLISCFFINLEGKKLNILTTTGMIEDLLINIVKDKANVTSLMGSGVDPHLYKATYQDIKKLQNADIIVYNGFHLEGKLQNIFNKLSRKKPVFALSDSLDKNKIIYVNKAKDPHIWFDISLWKQASKELLNFLIKYDSKNKQYYEKNANDYIKKLEKLHLWVKAKILSIPKESRILISAHDAFGYFSKAYKIEVKALQGTNTATQFGLNDIKKLKKLIIQRNIKAVFTESSVPKKFLESLVQGVKAQGKHLTIAGELYSDAMGTKGSKEGTYIGMFKHNVNTIVQALKR